MKAGRPRCLRCGEDLVAADPPSDGSVNASSSALAWLANRNAQLTLAGAALCLVLGALVLQLRASTTTVPLEATKELVKVPAAPVRPAEAPALLPNQSSEPTSLDSDLTGRAAYARGDFAAALAAYQRGLEKNPNDPNLLNSLAQCLVRMGRAEEAIPYFERAITLNANSWAPRFNLAHAHGVLNQWPKAVARYREAVPLFPDDYVTHYNLGLALHKNGEEAEAISEFQKAIELAPSETSFHLSLAISYERLHKPVEAAGAYEDYLRMNPLAPDAASMRSHIESLKRSTAGEDSAKPG